MDNEFTLREEVSLGISLHDGGLESVTSNAFDRSVTIVVDVPYLWSFHGLPSEIRFRLVVERVQVVEALKFEPWPGEFMLPTTISWEESQALRSDNYAKGRLESMDWQVLAKKLQRTNQYEISQATLTPLQSNTLVLKLSLLDDEQEYPEIRLSALQVRFFIGPDRELTLEEFLSLGKAYWDDWESRFPAPVNK